jgi:hypothetical protein
VKTKDLIRQLQKADPSGELECSVHGKDVFFVEQEPGWKDGHYEVLIRDVAQPGYNVIGAKASLKGEKITIHTLSIQDALWDNPDLQVECQDANRRVRELVESWRGQARPSE